MNLLDLLMSIAFFFGFTFFILLVASSCASRPVCNTKLIDDLRGRIEALRILLPKETTDEGAGNMMKQHELEEELSTLSDCEGGFKTEDDLEHL